MKRNNTLVFALLVIITSVVSSCQAIGDLMKASFWGGIIVAALVVGIIIWLISKAKK